MGAEIEAQAAVWPVTERGPGVRAGIRQRAVVMVTAATATWQMS
jgi:hypothetical protein